MKKVVAPKFIKAICTGFEKHSAQILTAFGITGGITTVVLTGLATVKAVRDVDKAIEERNKVVEFNPEVEPITKLPPKEVVKITWKHYIPAAASGAMSIACLIGANSISTRRIAALATAYKISETAFTEYKDQALSVLGEKKEATIRDAVAKKHVEDNPVANKEVIMTGKGNVLCCDSISGRYFKSDIDTIRRAENDLNKRMLSEMYISLTEFYYEIGLRPTKCSDDLGWNIEGGMIEIDFSSQLADDGTPCLVLDYRVAPRYDFSKLM